MVNGDERKGRMLMKDALSELHIQIERVSELVPRIFTASVLLQIFEQTAKQNVVNASSKAQEDSTGSKR